MEAIVLARHDIREADQMISLYTKAAGKKELFARGVKKSVSKNAAHLEPCSYIHATIVAGKEFGHLIKVQPIHFFSAIRADYTKSLAAGYISTLMHRMVQVGEPDGRIFELLYSWLQFVEKVDTVNAALVDGYIIKLFGCLGFTPTTEQCVVCDRAARDIFGAELEEAGHKPGIYFAGGGLICQECRGSKQEIGEHIMTCGLTEISDLQLLIAGDWSVIDQMKLDTGRQDRLHGLTQEFAVYHSEKQIPDWSRVVPNI